MTRCSECDTELATPNPPVCPSCGATLGQPERLAAQPGATEATPELILFEGHPAAVANIAEFFVCLLTLGLAWIGFFFRAKAKLYKITTRRVVIESGVFSKRMEQIDLYRIVDYIVERPFGQRVLGTGNLIIEASDRTTKEMRIDNVRTDVKELYEKLRAATDAERTRRGIRMLEQNG